jgi:hypothetical protein
VVRPRFVVQEGCEADTLREVGAGIVGPHGLSSAGGGVLQHVATEMPNLNIVVSPNCLQRIF